MEIAPPRVALGRFILTKMAKQKEHFEREESLSDKIIIMNLNPVIHGIDPDDVKEFIRQLREEFSFVDRNDAKRFEVFIKRKAGDKLIE